MSHPVPVRPRTARVATAVLIVLGIAFGLSRAAAAQTWTLNVTGVTTQGPDGQYADDGTQGAKIVFAVQNTSSASETIYYSSDCGPFMYLGYYDQNGNWVDYSFCAGPTDGSIAASAGQTVNIAVPIRVGVWNRGPVTLSIYSVNGSGVRGSSLSTSSDVIWQSSVLTASYAPIRMTPRFVSRIISVSKPAYVNTYVSQTLTNIGNITSTYAVSGSCSRMQCSVTIPTAGPVNAGYQTGASMYVTPLSGAVDTVILIATAPAAPDGLVQADTAKIVVAGVDQNPPTVGVGSLPYPVYHYSDSATVTAYDVDGNVLVPTVTVNGNSVPVLSTSVPSPLYGNHSGIRAVYPLRPQPGANLLIATASDGVHQTVDSVTFYYDDRYDEKPVITHAHATQSIEVGQSVADTFTVKNPGPLTAGYYMQAWHAWAGTTDSVVSTVTPQSVTLAPGSSAQVLVSYTAPASPSVETVMLHVTHSAAFADDSMVDNVAALLPPSATISPASGATISSSQFLLTLNWCDPDDPIVSRTVTFQGVTLPDNYTSQTPAGSCKSMGTSTWSLSAAPWQDTVVASVTDAAGHVGSSTAVLNYSVAISQFQPTVTPKSAIHYVHAASSQMQYFTIRNSGYWPATYALTPDCGTMAGCSVDRSTVMLAPAASDSVPVHFTSSSATGTAGRVTLTATYTAPGGQAVADIGTDSVYVPADISANARSLFQPQASILEPSRIVQPSATVGVGVMVKNLGNASTSYQLSYRPTGAVAYYPWLMPDSTPVAAPGQTVVVTANPVAPSSPDMTGSLIVYATHADSVWGTVSDSATVFITSAVLTPAIAVTPIGGEQQALTGASRGDAAFSIANNGNTNVTGNATVSCSGLVMNCQFEWQGSPTSLGFGVSIGGVTQANLTYDIDSTAVTNVGVMRVTAADEFSSARSTDSIVFHRAGVYAAISVSPKSIVLLVRPSLPTINQIFTVTNVGTDTSAVAYKWICAGQAASCTAGSGTTPVLVPNQSYAVTVQYASGVSNGLAGSVRLTASAVADSLATAVGLDSVITAPGSAIAVHTAALNPGANISRGACLTFAAGDEAAYECGDLRLVHVLPATTTMNKRRAPVLIYSSAHAGPQMTVAADVIVSPGTNPTTIRSTIAIDDHGTSKTFTQDIPWNVAWSNGLPHRVAVSFNPASKSIVEGVYKYTYQVTTLPDSTSASESDTLVVVDRSNSHYGRGWWIDGLERISVATPDTSQRLWIGGDGSTRLYYGVQGSSPRKWAAAPLEGPDTLQAVADGYIRWLRNKAYVHFTQQGLQDKTVNHQGDVTSFAYNADGSLGSIQMPVPAGSAVAPTYRFTYGATYGVTSLLTQVDAPPVGSTPRPTRLQYQAQTNIVTTITDPDATTVGFTTDIGSGRVIARTGRLQDPATFDYDEAGKLRRAALGMSRSAEADIVTTFCAAESRGVGSCTIGVDTVGAHTYIDGPRTDVADTMKFSINRYGAPDTVVNALGHKTWLVRDAVFPLLVDTVTQPNGFRTAATYNSRGLPSTVTAIGPYGAGGGNSTTRYAWNPVWDYVDTTIAPMGERTIVGYDALGNRIWQEDARGDSTKAVFTYNASNQVETMLAPKNTSPTRIAYDSLGNLRRVTSPTGIINETFKDAVGRDTLVKTPTDTAQTESLKLFHRILYDIAGRDTVTLEWSGSDSLSVSKRYDLDGNLTQVSQRGNPDNAQIGTEIRRFTYDAAHRELSERFVHGSPAVEDEVLSWTYDPAGNVITGGRDAIGATLSYDAMNRLIRRAGSMLSDYSYDDEGNLKTANNPAARISRRYYPNGQIMTDTLHIASADWSEFNSHAYALTYTYDASGHRTAIGLPSQLAGVGAQASYAYDPMTGALASVTDHFGQAFTFQYDAAGRVSTQVWRAGNSPMTETRSYDPESRVSRRTVRLADNTVVHDDSLRYDPRDKVLFVSHTLEAGGASDAFAYNGRGQTLQSTMGSTVETLQPDAFGNLPQSNSRQARPGTAWSTFEPGSGRLQLRMTTGGWNPMDTTAYDTDLLGNVYHSLQQTSHGPFQAADGTQYSFLTLNTDIRDTYDDRSKLIAHTITYDTLFQASSVYDSRTAMVGPNEYVGQELYRYDALGRRVWARSNVGANCNSPTGSPQKWTGCHNTLTRTVWDGDQILYEIRTDGSTNASTITLENDGPTGLFNGVIGYVHAGGIDQPLALGKNGTTVLLATDWRGRFDAGLCGTSLCPSTQIKFPAKSLFGAANYIGTAPAPSWYGSLIEGQEDASGYLYRRNRYFDPSTGRFTQEDPIGLAGGMNLYGFADGDPVNYSDPFGLCPWTECLAQALANWGASHGGAAGAVALNAGAAMNAGFQATGINAAADAGDKIGSGQITEGLAEAAILIGGGKIAGYVAGRVAGALASETGADWTLGTNHSAQQWANKMGQRGWTSEQISEAIEGGEQHAAVNNVNKGNPATRYVHPKTGRSVVQDNVTKEVIHVGGDGYKYPK